MDNISDSLFTMLQLQRALNDREDRDWYTRQPPFLRAAATAAMEAMEHYGWRLWAAPAPDLEKVHHDMGRILYCLLGHAMSRRGRRDEELYRIARDIETMHANVGRRDAHFGMDFLEKLEILAGRAALREEGAVWAIFFSAIIDVGLDWETLSRAYFSEHILALFRQDYAHDRETYAQTWGDKDDRAHLEEILADVKVLDLAAIRQALVKRYSVLTGRRATDLAEPSKQ